MKNVNQLFDLMTKSDSFMQSFVWDRPFNEFTCEYCGQHFSKEFCQISVFLHGVIFLFGQETGYLGFTCANCQKTILFHGTGIEIRALHAEITSDSLSFNGALRLSYFSSANYYPSQISGLKKFDIKCSGHFVKDPWLEKEGSIMLRMISPDYTDGRNFTDIDKRPDLKQNYLCSDQDQMKNYSYNYLGHLVSLWWFKEDEIIKLRDLENTRNFRIFPRYVARQFTDFEPIENYCWKHQLYLAFLNTHLKMTKITNKEIEGSEHHMIFDGYHEPDDGEFVINDDNTIPLWQIENSIREEEKRRKTDLSQAAELAQILITPKKYWATQPSVDIQPSIEYWNNAAGLFESNKANKVITDFMPEDVEKWRQEKVEFHKMARTVRENFNKDYVQEFLTDNHLSFISAYTKLAQSKKFSYAAVWKLKEDILQSLCQYIRDKHKIVTLPKSAEAESTNEVLVKNDDDIDFEDLKNEINDYRNRFPAFRKIVSNNIQILKILQKIYVLASDAENKNFLILGEEGTGKELFVNAIHESTGSRNDLVSVDCGAIPENLFESEIFGLEKGAGVGIEKKKTGYLEDAENGTIFFDEVGNFSLMLQQKLLRVIQERKAAPVGGKPKPINTNFIFATNADLKDMVSKGQFRKDLLTRIKAYVFFEIPPLRKRKDDIPLLVKHFVKSHAIKHKMVAPDISDECLSKLMQYDWPENIRALEGEIERIMTIRRKRNLSGELTISEFNFPEEDMKPKQSSTSPQTDLPLAESKPKKKGKRGPQKTDAEIIAAYHKCGGNISKALSYLGQGNINNLRQRLVKLGVHIPKK